MNNLGVWIDFVKFILIFVLVCVVSYNLLRLTKKLTFRWKDFTLSFDFYIETGKEPLSPEHWNVRKNSNELETLSLEDFKFFVVNQIYLQVPLSKNDLDNFEIIYRIYKKELPEESDIFEKYYQRSYKFNIKFEAITKMVSDYKKAEHDVRRIV